MESNRQGKGDFFSRGRAFVLTRKSGVGNGESEVNRVLSDGDTREVVRLNSGNLPSLSEIEEAERKIRRYFPPTPIEYSKSISDILGRETFLKLETALPIHVFKIRGALNKFLSLPETELKRG